MAQYKIKQVGMLRYNTKVTTQKRILSGSYDRLHRCVSIQIALLLTYSMLKSDINGPVMSEFVFKYQDRIVFCELTSSYMQNNVIIGLPAQISMYRVPCTAVRSSTLSHAATGHQRAGLHTESTDFFCEALHWWFTPLLSSSNVSHLCQMNEPKTVNVFYQMKWK